MNITLPPYSIPTYKPINNSKHVQFGHYNRFFIPDKIETSVSKFNSDKEFREYVCAIMSKINSQLFQYTPKKLDRAINEVKLEHQDMSEKEILTVMQRLTQWANYRCLPLISKKLSELDVGQFEKFSAVNSCFSYFQSAKRIISTDSRAPYYGCIVTPKEAKNIFALNHPYNTKFINLEGFEQGVNIFDDDNKLASSAIETIAKIKKRRILYPYLDFEGALSDVLNSDLEELSSNKGVQLFTLQNNAPATRSAILSQMAPIAPQNVNSIARLITNVSGFFSKNEQELISLRNNIAKFYLSHLDVYTKQNLVENLKIMHSKIADYASINYIKPENMFYLIPPSSSTLAKSYEIITHMFAKVNDISAEKIIRPKNIADLNTFPQNSAFFILDDICASGESMSKLCNKNYLLGKDKHIICSPLIIHTDGMDIVNYKLKSLKRENVDDIISVISKAKKFYKNQEETALEDYFGANKTGQDAFGTAGFIGENGSISECVIFPYMTPDNNAGLSSFIADLFLPTCFPIRNLHSKFFDICEFTIKNNSTIKMLKTLNVFLKNINID